MVSSFFQDVRFAWRLARRQPLPSLTTLLTLAIGLGGTTALFSVANAWLLTPLPFHEPHRLVMAWETIPSAGIDQNTPAPAILKMWRERSQAFEGFAPWTVTTLKLTGGAEPLQVDGARVSKDMLPLLGIGPLLGRNFTADEDRAGGVSAALLSEPFWTRTFGRDASIVGRTIQLDGRPVAVIGVLPSSVRLIGLDADLWLPLALTAQEEESFNRILWVMGRLRPGVSAGQGLRDLDALLLRELEQVPGIQSAGLTQALPIRSSAMGAGFPIEGRRGDGSSILAYWRIVSASYFATMEMPMVSGRPFTAADRTGAPDVAIVSESFARRAWPDGSALGKVIGWGTLDRPMTVIGVVGDVRVTPASAPGPHVYMPFMQITSRLPGDLVVRADGSIASVVDAVRRTVWAIDRTQPVAGVMTMDQLLWNATGRRRFQLTLVSLFAGVAALLALIGIYSVLSYAVGQSLREIGIRLALGASPSRVRWLVLREGLIVLALGSGAGLLLALWSGQLVRAFLFNLEPVDPMTYIVVVSGLMLAGFAACGLPAVRASRVDPIVTLRAE